MATRKSVAGTDAVSVYRFFVGEPQGGRVGSGVGWRLERIPVIISGDDGGSLQ